VFSVHVYCNLPKGMKRDSVFSFLSSLFSFFNGKELITSYSAPRKQERNKPHSQFNAIKSCQSDLVDFMFR